MVTATAHRVTKYTAPDALVRIYNATIASVEYHLEHPSEIPARLDELDREWDIERMLETGSSTLTLASLLLGITVDRKWLFVGVGVQGFFLQHALRGWCPPLPVLRNLGVRTAEEIEVERFALTSILQRTAVADLTAQLALVRAAGMTTAG